MDNLKYDTMSDTSLQGADLLNFRKKPLLPELHTPVLADKPWIDKIVFKENSSSADFSFGGQFICQEDFHQRLTKMDGRMVVYLTESEKNTFVCPIGTGPIRPVIEAMHEYAQEHNHPFVMAGVTEHYKQVLEDEFPEKFVFVEMIDFEDYVYSIDKLADLGGRKLHGKRNHIHQFEKTYEDWSFSALSRKDFDECISLMYKWEELHEKKQSIYKEEQAIRLALDHFEELGFSGGILRVDGKIAAFCIGECVSNQVYVTHFEKGDPSVNGVYPMINREFARMIRKKFSNIQWINREDDMGLLHLRRSKQSYHPDFMVRKFNAIWK